MDAMTATKDPEWIRISSYEDRPGCPIPMHAVCD